MELNGMRGNYGSAIATLIDTIMYHDVPIMCKTLMALF